MNTNLAFFENADSCGYDMEKVYRITKAPSSLSLSDVIISCNLLWCFHRKLLSILFSFEAMTFLILFLITIQSMENLINLSTSASDERNEVISNSNDKVSSLSKHLGGNPK